MNCEEQSHKTVSTDHNFWRERRAEADSNRGPSAYQPNALPLGQTGSQDYSDQCGSFWAALVTISNGVLSNFSLSLSLSLVSQKVLAKTVHSPSRITNTVSVTAAEDDWSLFMLV